MAATPEEIARLRLMVDEPTTSVYSDQNISDIFDQAEGDMDLAAAEIWQQKAARYSTLVDTSESGSSRSMSQLSRNATAQAKFYADKVQVDIEVATERRPTTRTAVRR